MKKLLLILAIAASLVSCEKETPELGRGQILQDWYFSRVRFYGDERAGSTDTIWTIRLVTDSMRRTFEEMDGYIYDDHSPQWIEIGRMWEKKR